ncbi:MAG: CbiX/SirB N-terminal domain-containing protein [Burkholderiales bacterium]|nr:CbiX/SirB N-terminal domain-containing protein [Burkholderiales bacterium]
MPERAIVLFAHGASDPRWAEPLRLLKAELETRLPGERVALAFVERMSPSLAECARALHAEGVRRLRIVVFIGAGGHLRTDLPQAVCDLEARLPDLHIAVDPPIGEQPQVLAAIAEAIARCAPR